MEYNIITRLGKYIENNDYLNFYNIIERYEDFIFQKDLIKNKKDDYFTEILINGDIEFLNYFIKKFNYFPTIYINNILPLLFSDKLLPNIKSNTQNLINQSFLSGNNEIIEFILNNITFNENIRNKNEEIEMICQSGNYELFLNFINNNNIIMTPNILLYAFKGGNIKIINFIINNNDNKNFIKSLDLSEILTEIYFFTNKIKLNYEVLKLIFEYYYDEIDEISDDIIIKFFYNNNLTVEIVELLFNIFPNFNVNKYGSENIEYKSEIFVLLCQLHNEKIFDFMFNKFNKYDLKDAFKIALNASNVDLIIHIYYLMNENERNKLNVSKLISLKNFDPYEIIKLIENNILSVKKINKILNNKLNKLHKLNYLWEEIIEIIKFKRQKSSKKM